MKNIQFMVAGILLSVGICFPLQAQQNNITVFASTESFSGGYDFDATQLGKLLKSNNKTLIYNGNTTGLMGSVLKGISDTYQPIKIITTPKSYEINCQKNNSCRKQEVIFADSVSEQMNRMFDAGDAIVILPGSWDMLHIFTTYAVQVQNGERPAKPVVFLNTNHWWDNFRYQIDEFKRQKKFDADQIAYISFIDKPRDILKEITLLNKKIRKTTERNAFQEKK